MRPTSINSCGALWLHQGLLESRAGPLTEEVVSDLSPSDGAGGFPEVLAPVTLRLRLADGVFAELPSRVGDVEDVDGVRHVVVDRPDTSGLAEPGRMPHEGEELTLLWVRPTGQMQLRVAAVAANRPYGPVWVLTPIGAPTREQRREFFRIPLTVPAVLTPVVDGARSAETAVRATLVEVSEGGALICCEAGLPEPGTLVELSFSLEDKRVIADAEVLRHVVPPTGRPRAALRFLDPAAYGDHIRRVAFSVQRARARTRLS